MGTRTRCPVCNRFGSDALSGYCSTCYNSRVEQEEKNAWADYPGFGSDNPFFPKKFGIIKDKFGYER